MRQHQRRMFSVHRNKPEGDDRRIHFQRISHNPRKMVRRPFWWLLVLLLVVIVVLLYLNNIR